MKLYSVNLYKEIYYKALYRPLWSALKIPERETWVANPTAFMQDIIDPPTRIYSTLWIPNESFNDANRQHAEIFYASMLNFHEWFAHEADYGNALQPGPQRDAMKAWVYHYNQWFAEGIHTSDQWGLLRAAWSDVWAVMTKKNQEYWTARYYWWQIHQSAPWIQLRDAYFQKMRESPIHLEPFKEACESADFAFKLYLKDKFTIKDIRREMYGPDVVTRFLKILEPYFGQMWRVISANCLFILAGIAILALILNVKQKGVRLRFYGGTAWIITYKNALWWADIIAKTAHNKTIYMRCRKMPALICRQIVHGPRTPGAYEDLLLVPEAGGEVQEDMWWWLIWPWHLQCQFRGFLYPIGRDWYALKQQYANWDCKPWYYYRDRAGNQHKALPTWWKDEPNTACAKPTKKWCTPDGEPEWVLHPNETPAD